MLQGYKKLNQIARRFLWWVIILGMIAALPLAYGRWTTERSANTVEIAFDYRDLIEMSDYMSNPQSFIQEQLDRMKTVGIQTMAVYESNLNELKLERRLQLYSAQEASVMLQDPELLQQNFTYLLFADKQAQQSLQPMIEQEFSALGIRTSSWDFQGRDGLLIEMPAADAVLHPLDPDPLTMAYLRDQGFQLAVRLSDTRSYDQQAQQKLFTMLEQFGVKRIIFSGNAVTGYADDADKHAITAFAQLMNQHNIGFATIELLKEPQKGLNKLAYLTDYNAVRLHSLSEDDARNSVRTLSDRLLLAVKDRNIRMIYLNANVAKDPDTQLLSHPLENLYASLTGPQGAMHRIEQAGFQFGTAKAFNVANPPFQMPLKLLVTVGAVALIALTLAAFLKRALFLFFSVGLLGTAGLGMLSSSFLLKGLALGVGICAPTLAVILAIRAIQRKKTDSGRIRFAIGLLVRTSLVSLLGVIYVVGLLNNITYSLVLEQFRGVSLLHLAPIALIGVYVLFFGQDHDNENTLRGGLAQVRHLLKMNITLLWVAVAAVLGVAALYYLSRTGNAGQASSYEIMFRSMLENTLGVRPRTKEFLLAHPLFILGAYLAVKHRAAFYLLIVAVMGQLSIVDTFAHLHTPLAISLIRVTYGVVIGSLIGLLFIAVWEWGVKCWNRCAPLFKD